MWTKVLIRWSNRAPMYRSPNPEYTHPTLSLHRERFLRKTILGEKARQKIENQKAENQSMIIMNV